MNRLAERFESLRGRGDAGLVVFITAGDPDLETTVKAVWEFGSVGVDMVELGIPFSDPLADGPVIQASSDRALRKGATIPQILETVRAIRQQSEMPLVFMTYFNPVLQYGIERFAKDSAAAGADGALITDLPPEEAEDWLKAARAHDLATIFLLAPTSTEERINQVCEVSTGFIYCVSRLGVTGERDQLPPDLKPLVQAIRSRTEKPIAVGFGISKAEHVRAVVKEMPADAVVIGSALVRLLHEALLRHAQDAVAVSGWDTIRDFLKGLKQETVGAKASLDL